ncbi:MAG: hypothetical protein CV081_11315 [Nitrospira sp. LK265]|nr:hypothetical protein [Nitrospira sp. LK265]
MSHMLNKRRISGRLLLPVLLLLVAAPAALAETTIEGRAFLFYTDDVALFSATRRFNLDGDPTQPVLDSSLIGKGSDMVFEPEVNVMKAVTSRWGRTEFSFRGQGYVYAVDPGFNHGTAGLQMLHHISPNTRVRLRYYTAPNLLLGDNESRRTDSIQEERVTSHIGSLRLEHNLSKQWEVRLLARYGARLYNDEWAQRDTTFWTIGPHLVWHFMEHYAIVAGYHYERGLADGRNQPQFEDDTSYVNNYVTIGLEAEVTHRLSAEISVHFERNDWTTGIEGDERKGGHETVWQGQCTFRYRVAERVAVLAGFQRSQRKQSFEGEIAYDTNLFLGGSYTF